MLPKLILLPLDKLSNASIHTEVEQHKHQDMTLPTRHVWRAIWKDGKTDLDATSWRM